MIDVELLNTRTPYKVYCSSTNELFFSFVTDFDVEFSVGFMLDDIISADETYQFVIANVNSKKSPNDKKVQMTVMCLIDEFFSQNNSTVLYICETGDGKQAMRNRLFQHWFSQYENRRQLTYISSSIIDEEGIENYATLVVRNDNPNLVAVISEFTETVSILNSKPQD